MIFLTFIMQSTTSYTNKNNRIQPKKFALWLGIVSITMMFAGFTSAFIVRRLAGNWVQFKLPNMFWISTAVIIASSATMYLAQRFFKTENKFPQYRLFLGITLILGIVFLILQYQGWQEMTNYGILLNGNPSGSFVYIISGVHAAHIIGGLLFLVIAFVKSLVENTPVKQLIKQTNPDAELNVELLSIYWHFVDIVWVYLFLFFLYYR